MSFVACMPERYHEDVRSSSLRMEIGSRATDGSGVEGDGEREGCVVDDVESIALDTTVLKRVEGCHNHKYICYNK